MQRSQRHHELNRLYLAAGLAVLVWMIFDVYKVLGARVDSSLDATSRWSLLSVGLINAVVIATLLFIIARSLAKLYFERRSGILGARLRTKLVVSLLAVGILPSLMLFIVGRNFISKNLDRWFRPETQQDFRDNRQIIDAYREQMALRLKTGMVRLPLFTTEDLPALRREADLDLLAKTDASGKIEALDSIAPFPGAAASTETLETPAGLWILQRTPAGQDPYLGGVLIPQALLESLARQTKRHGEALMLERSRESLEPLPKAVFTLLALLSLFAAVWVGLALSRTISEPIRALAKAAQRVGTGDLDVALPEEGEDELAFLNRSFNAMTRDIRASREAIEMQREAIEAQREYLGQLLEALPVGVMSWHGDGELITFNPAARRWFGLETWSLIEGSWQELATQPRMGGLPGLVIDVLETRRPHLEELRIGSEGEGRPIRADVVPLSTGGVLAVLEDLSLLAQAEKRAAWQEVARRMAHEVKNPLTPIKLTAQRLLRRCADGRLEPESLKAAMETILTEVGSLSRLVDNFSRFAKLPAPQPAWVDACDLVQQVQSLYAQDRAGLRVEAEIPPGPIQAYWDADMIKRALINLVDNALGALEGTQEGVVRLSFKVQDDRAHLTVEDNGPGVPEAFRAKLFEPYFSTKSRGTGLGLAIVRRIAQDHGGESDYQALEPGSRFTVELPLQGRKESTP